jgi:predicted dinucleotide-binding enzyme
MEITIIGYGSVGSTLARSWTAAGHEVTVGAYHPDDPRARELAAQGITVVPVPESLADPGVVLLATPAHVAIEVADQIGDAMGDPGRTIFIDATNTVSRRPEPYVTAADALVDRLGTGHVVKCFNTTGAENMDDPGYGDTALDMFVAGDSDRAKEVAAGLSADAGFATCYDVGDSSYFISLEQMARIWINLAHGKGHGRGIGFKVLQR